MPQKQLKKEEPLPFEELLDEYEYERPKQGEIVEAEVVKVDEDMILVDLGGKSDAAVPRQDLKDLEDSLLDEISAGDKIPVYVTRSPAAHQKPIVSISKGLEKEDWERAEDKLESKEVIELPVVGKNRGGLLVEFGRLRGFVPNSHVPDLRRVSDREKMDEVKSDMIGSNLMVTVIEADSKERQLILSAMEAQSDARRKKLEELEPGQVHKGRVVNLVDFGAFVDLGGVDGLIHISELDWHRVVHPSKVLDVGDEVEVKVTDVDVERERVGLSRKALLPNPWDTLKEHLQEEDVIEGTVTNLQEYGAFVRLPPGVDGLLHVTELNGAEPRVDELDVGDTVKVKVTDIDYENEEVSLSLAESDNISTE